MSHAVGSSDIVEMPEKKIKGAEHGPSVCLCMHASERWVTRCAWWVSPPVMGREGVPHVREMSSLMDNTRTGGHRGVDTAPNKLKKKRSAGKWMYLV